MDDNHPDLGSVIEDLDPAREHNGGVKPPTQADQVD
jgi:hypothetical protein